MTQKTNDILVKIREERPFIFNISNFFPMDLLASGVRSLGAFLVMSNAKQEIEELLGLSKAVVINLLSTRHPAIDNGSFCHCAFAVLE